MSIVTPDQLIETFPALRVAGDDLPARLVASSTWRNMPAGTLLYSEGDACPGFAMLFAGRVRIYKAGTAGREIPLYEIGPGETCILNASCILSNAPYPANAEATHDAELILVPAVEFRRAMDDHPAMRGFIFGLLAERLALVMALVEEVAFGRMDERLMDYLVEKSSDGEIETTNQRLADDLGTSGEVVSRLLKHFEHAGRLGLSRNRIRLLP
jgi:CRP/FNR family transcriptional regulator